MAEDLTRHAFEVAECSASEQFDSRAYDDCEIVGMIRQAEFRADGSIAGDDLNDSPASANMGLYGPWVDVRKGDRVLVLRDGRPVMPSMNGGSMVMDREGREAFAAVLEARARWLRREAEAADEAAKQARQEATSQRAGG